MYVFNAVSFHSFECDKQLRRSVFALEILFEMSEVMDTHVGPWVRNLYKSQTSQVTWAKAFQFLLLLSKG